MTVVAVLNHHYSVASYVLAYWIALHSPTVHVIVIDHGLSPTMPPIIANCQARYPVDMTPIPALPLQPVQYEGPPVPPYLYDSPILPTVAVTPAEAAGSSSLSFSSFSLTKWWSYWYYHPHQVIEYIRNHLPANVTVLSLRNLSQLHRDVGGIWFDFGRPDDSDDAVVHGANVTVRTTSPKVRLPQWAYWSRLGVQSVRISAVDSPFPRYLVDAGGKLLDIAGLLAVVAPQMMVRLRRVPVNL